MLLCCQSGDHTWSPAGLNCLLKTERSNNIGILLGSVKIHKLSIHSKILSHLRCTGHSASYAIDGSGSCCLGWVSLGHDSHPGSRVLLLSIIHPAGTRRSKSVLWCATRLIFAWPTRSFDSASHCPFYCASCLCACYMWLLSFSPWDEFS